MLPYCIKLSDKPLMGSTLAHFGLGFPQGDIFVTENRVNSDRIITFELYYMIYLGSVRINVIIITYKL